MEQLAVAEAHRLEILESVIDAGMKTFVAVGNSLLEIRDLRLYRATHGTFEDYCRERWGLARNRAYQLMDAAQVVGNIAGNVQNFGHRESHVAPLTVLEPEAQREIWQRVIDTAPDGRVTAAYVQTVVDEYRQEVSVNVEDAWGHVETVTVDQSQEARPHVTYNSGNNEWYTPAEYIDAAYEVMGEIHLDPASSARANEIVEANEYFDAERNGLEQPWGGCVWMNPPYAAELIGKFCAKFAHHVRSGEIEQGIVLVNNATETEWFSTLVGVCTAFVFPRGRVRFWQPSGTLGAPLQGQAILYAGPHVDRFLDVFTGFGWGAKL